MAPAEPLELVILVGLQASGKTTFQALRYGGSHVLVSKDRFPNARDRNARQAREITAALSSGRSVVVDNTNPARADRAPLVALARQFGARVVVCFFPPDLRASIERNAGRTGRALVPVPGIFATAKRLEPPSWDEGMDELHVVRISLADGGFADDTLPPGSPLA